jgi:hypothetical protein
VTKSGQDITVRSMEANVISNVKTDVMDHMIPTVSTAMKTPPGTLHIFSATV